MKIATFHSLTMILVLVGLAMPAFANPYANNELVSPYGPNTSNYGASPQTAYPQTAYPQAAYPQSVPPQNTAAPQNILPQQAMRVRQNVAARPVNHPAVQPGYPVTQYGPTTLDYQPTYVGPVADNSPTHGVFPSSQQPTMAPPYAVNSSANASPPQYPTYPYQSGQYQGTAASRYPTHAAPTNPAYPQSIGQMTAQPHYVANAYTAGNSQTNRTAANAPNPVGSPITPLQPNPSNQSNYYDSYINGQQTESIPPGEQVQGGYVQGGPLQGGPNDGYGCADGSCGPGGLTDACFGRCKRWRGGWYGSMGALYMARDRPGRRVLTSEVPDPTLNILDNRDSATNWEGGFEVTLGRCISDCLRWEIGYWYLNPFEGFNDVLDPGGQLVTPLDLNNVGLGPDLLSDFFDNSSGHETFRENRFRNLELNLYYRLCCRSACDCYGGGCGSGGGGYGGYGGHLGGGCGPVCCRPQKWNIELLTGIRYFEFDEYFIFAGVEGGANFGDLGGAREAYIISDVENQLIGAQLGALIEYNLSCNWTIYARPKFGIYGNRAELDFDVVRGNGADNGQNLITGDLYPVNSSKDDLALLAELDMGVRWNFGCHWSAFAGYRIIGINGVALADNQIPFQLADLQGVRDINTNKSLILHGFNMGLGFQY